MSLKRKTKVTEGFSMASMTDVIFLLLIFFLVASTVIIPNSIKVSLPSAQQQPTLDETTNARVTITPTGELFLGIGTETDVAVSMEEFGLRLERLATSSPTSYVAIHADETVPYRKVVEVISSVSRSKLKVVLATKVSH